MLLLFLVRQNLCKVDPDILEQYKFRRFEFNSSRHLRTHIGNNKKEYLHRLIMNPDPGFVVDHIDRDPTNNLRSNLRIVTHSQNLYNSNTSSANSSGSKGVSVHKASGKYTAYIKVRGLKIHLGYFTTVEQAAEARRKAELLYVEII